MNRSTLKKHLSKRNFASCQMVKGVASDEQLMDHLKDWCEAEANKVNKRVSNVLTMDLTDDATDVISDNNNNTLSNVVPRPEPVITHTIAAAATTGAENRDITKKFCFCQKTYDEDNASMIECSNNPCLSIGSTNSWFHKKCLKSRSIPLPKRDTDDWYCPPCVAMRQYNTVIIPDVSSSSRSSRTKK